MGAYWFEGAAIYLPLGIIGVVRWAVWILKKLVGFLYRAESAGGDLGASSCGLGVSIVTPVFQEDVQAFSMSLDSWISNRPREIIAVIDSSDTECARLFEQRASVTTETRLRLIVTSEPGKRPALARGILEARGSIVALVDSDTIWEPHSLPSLTVPFLDEKVGGVVPRQEIYQPKTLSQKLSSLIFELRYADELPFLGKMDQGFSCLSGRTALYRRAALIPILDEMVHERFFGRPCISGEDKRLTYLVQSRGYRTKFQGNVTVHTFAPPDLATLLKQKTRWTRNSWRADLRALTQGWLWRRPVLAFYLLDKSVAGFTVLISPMFLGLAIYLHHWPIAVAIPIWWLVSRFIKALPYLQRRPKDLWIVPVFVVLGFLLGVIKIFTLVTLNKQGWLTRERPDAARRSSKIMLSPAISYLATGAMLTLLFLGVIGYSRAIGGGNVRSGTLVSLASSSIALGADAPAVGRVNPGTPSNSTGASGTPDPLVDAETELVDAGEVADSEDSRVVERVDLRPEQEDCGPTSYVVQKGESLAYIAGKMYGGDTLQWDVLAAANDLVDPSLIYPGQVLVVPRC